MGLVKLIKRGSMAVVLFLGVMAAGSVADAEVTVDGSTIRLNGQSVVIKEAAGNNIAIYRDDDGDGIAEGSTPIKTTTTGSGDYTIYGYWNPSSTLTSDLSICMESGTVNAIYGIYRSSSSASVNVAIKGGTVKSVARAADSSSVLNAGLKITGGTFKSKCMVACSTDSTVTGDVNLQFTGDAILEDGESDNTMLQAATGGTVNGDVNVLFGNTSARSSAASNVSFYVCNAVTVNNNLNVTIDGDWNNSNSLQLLGEGITNKKTIVKGNMKLNWIKGKVTPKLYCLYDGATECELKGDFNITVQKQENKNPNGNIYVLKSASVTKSVGNVNIDSLSNNVGISNYDKLEFTGKKYINIKGALNIDGVPGTKHTFDEDIQLSNLTISENVHLIVKDDVNITTTLMTIKGILDNNGYIKCNGSNRATYIYGTLNNNGKIDCNYTLYVGDSSNHNNALFKNNGEVNCSNRLYIYGKFDNNGNLKTAANSSSTMAQKTSFMVVNADGMFINESGGILEINCALTNSSKIYNYGTIKQNYSGLFYNELGAIYTTGVLEFKKDFSDYDSASKLYYKISKAFPSHCIDGSNITISGAEGEYIASDDGNAYMLAGKSFSVTVGDLKTTEYKLNSITYGSSGTEAIKNGSSYTGTMGYELTTVTLNFGPAGQVTNNISLDKSSDTVNGLKVGVKDDCFYDLSTLIISGDSGIGQVTYKCNQSDLPEGLSLSGTKISGTPTKAVSNETKVIFTVTGVNQTTAEFTLTFSAVAKGDAILNLPTDLKSNVGKKLSDIKLPYDENGTFKWKNGNTVLSTYNLSGINYPVCFTPKDKDNYDWEGLAKDKGYEYSNGVITANVKVKVDKGYPEYQSKVPTGLKATYGQTLRNISLPSDSDGTFSWQESLDTPVGSPGVYSHPIKYTPKNSGYYEVSDIMVNVTVSKAQPTFFESISKPQSVNAVYGDKLKDINLPIVSGGTGSYKWISQENTLAEDGKKYILGFKPKDTVNYDWTGINGWNASSGCVEFEVIARVAKAMPEFSSALIFEKLSATYGDKLGDIAFPNVSVGSYKWISSETTLAKNNTIYKVGYCPKDIIHYSWEQIEGWNSAENCVEFAITVEVAPATPVFSNDMKISSFSAVYGDALSDITLPGVSGGRYAWKSDSSTKVSNGVYYELSYIPNDIVNYDWSKVSGWDSSIKRVVWSVTINVAKATPSITKSPVSINAEFGKKLSDYQSQLPSVKNGVWYKGSVELSNPLVSAAGLPNGEIKFKDSSLTLSEANVKNIKVLFVPEDAANYNSVEMGISVVITHSHSYVETLWESDDYEHWYGCVSCGAKKSSSVAAHVWKETNSNDKTVKECTICGKKTEHVHRYVLGQNETHHYNICRDCSYNTTPVAHKYGEWELVDGNSHMRICECGYTQTADHQWDDGSEVVGGKKIYTCTDCGTTKVHEHTYGAWTKIDSDTHKRTCTDSSCKYTDIKAHNWSVAEETSDGTGTVRICINCNAKQNHVHEFGELEEKDDETHCSRCECGAITNVEEHSYGAWTKRDNKKHWKKCECGSYIEEEHVWDDGEELLDGRIKYICSECGSIDVHEHQYNKYGSDEESHWKECECGAEIDFEEHTLGDWESDEDNHWKSCECGYVLSSKHIWIAGEANEDGSIEYTCSECGMTTFKSQDSHVHNWTDWQIDEQYHWQVCVCGENSIKEFHKWNAGENTADGKIKFTCTVCGYVKYEDVPPITQPPADSGQTTAAVPIGGKVEDTGKNVSVKVTKSGVVDANGKLVGAEAVYTGPVKKTSKIEIPDVIFDEAGNSYSVTAIAPNALKNDKTVTTVKIGNNIVNIGSGAFSGCVKLKSVLIGNNVSKIDKQAFAGCKKLKTITIKSTKITKIGKKAFKGINKKAVFKVPKKKLKAYKKLFKSSVGFKKTMKIKA